MLLTVPPVLCTTSPWLITGSLYFLIPFPFLSSVNICKITYLVFPMIFVYHQTFSIFILLVKFCILMEICYLLRWCIFLFVSAVPSLCKYLMRLNCVQNITISILHLFFLSLSSTMFPYIPQEFYFLLPFLVKKIKVSHLHIWW